MRRFLSTLLLLGAVLTQTTFASDEVLARRNLILAADESVESTILALYNDEMANSASPLASLMSEITASEVEDMGTLYAPTERDMWLISSGRGGYGHYGRTYLLGLPVLWNGTGMIEEYLRYVVVYVNLKIGEGEEGEEITVTFEKLTNVEL